MLLTRPSNGRWLLVLIDGGGGIDVSPTVVYLNEENNYHQSVYLMGEGAWSISGVTEHINLTSSSGQLSGVGNARIDVTKTVSLVEQGGYSTFFTVTNSNGTEIRVDVYITVSQPLTVNGTGNGGTINITLNQGNNYTETLTIIRDREWIVEGVDINKINVSPTSGNGAELPGFASTFTVTKSPLLTTTSATTYFDIVSGEQRVRVNITITLTITLEFVDPRFDVNEVGVTAATENLYLYV